MSGEHQGIDNVPPADEDEPTSQGAAGHIQKGKEKVGDEKEEEADEEKEQEEEACPGRMLQQAAIYNNTDFMESLLQGPEALNLNEQDLYGRTPLYTSVSHNSLECAHMLLQCGADPNIQSNSKCECMTPLHKACADNKHKFVTMLMEYGADCNQEDASGHSATTLAAKLCHEECLQSIRWHTESKGREKEQIRKDFIQMCKEGDSEAAEKLSEKIPSEEIKVLINTPQDNQLSLLHRACERDAEAVVHLLLRLGAEVVVHPVNGQTALHVACQHGSISCARALLQHSPQLIRAPTIDGTFPLHLGCIEGQSQIVQFLINFPYPDCVKKLFKELTGEKMYRLGLALNAKDGHGRTPLHAAVMHNQLSVVETLLRFKVPVLQPPMGEQEEREQEGVIEEFRPVEVDILDLDGNTPLHLAVKGDGQQGYHKVANLLLHCGANPNRPMISPSGNSTPLMEACTRSDIRMMDLLLKYGGKDDQHRVLAMAIRFGHEAMTGTLLQGKCHVDANYKVNYMAITEEHPGGWNSMMTTSIGTGSLKNLWPNVPVVINWHALTLRHLSMSWLRKCCRQQLGKPPVNLNHRKLCLYAITRIDISSNSLGHLPLDIFKLPSLRVLNASCNQIKYVRMVLATPPVTAATAPRDAFEHTLHDPLSNENSADIWEPSPDADQSLLIFDAPLLEEVDLHSNKFSSLPAALFSLESLKRLDASHNQISTLPFDMWMSNSLTEINLSHNNLSSLPSVCYEGLPSEANGLSPFKGDSPSTSVPSTPKRSIQEEDESQVDEPSEALISSASSDLAHDIPLSFISHWRSKIRVELSQGRQDRDMHSEKALQELNLSHNLFEVVPHGLACLAPQLQKLNLSNNHLSQVGALNTYPVALRSLDLSQNLITDAEPLSEESPPFKICLNPLQQLKPSKSAHKSAPRRPASTSSLHSLSSGMQLFCSHRCHKRLEKLRSLKLANNKLTQLQLLLDPKKLEAEEIEEMERKKRLSCTYHSPEPEISAEDALLFPTLTALDACGNQLISIPSEISMLQNLSELKVAGNRLKELPPDMGLLKKLWNLDFSGCPVERTLLAVLGGKARKTVAVLSYLKSIKEEAQLYNRMKLMFVGLQGIGKTSLLKQLRREGKSNPTKQQSWAQRMGESSMKSEDHRGENLSTVGVDIGDLVLQRGGREVIFSTWDFGGQREYYATHQYFLSKRSLYLVVWKVTEGERGLHSLLQWLVNIQARAPNAPVIIVGTHLDQVKKMQLPTTHVVDMHQLIIDRYMSHAEPEKCGLPRVVGCVMVSCKRMLMFNDHIADLVNLIWRTVSEEPVPGSRGDKLLDQKVPASYVHLQDVILHLAQQRKQEAKDPVLHAEQYKPMVIQKMEELCGCSFRDVAELNQATQFLHENGVLLHYDDVSLQDVYFLDPQWLCDILANVVSIREINSLARCGIMRADDLKVLFKNAAFRPEDIKTYIINLLAKFEVALMWDEQNLLIPSLLPTEQAAFSELPGTNVRIPVKYRGGKKGPPLGPGCSRSPLRVDFPFPMDSFSSSSSSSSGNKSTPSKVSQYDPVIAGNPNPAVCMLRLYVMSYFPSGFWPRLITRLLGDEAYYALAVSMFDLPDAIREAEGFLLSAGVRPEWRCWQSGVELLFLDQVLLRLKDVQPGGQRSFCDYFQCQLALKTEGSAEWSPLDLEMLSILEIFLPNESITVNFDFPGNDGFQGVVVQPCSQTVAALLARTVDHVDTLLEDWYPDLGARFIQNARGMYLITRLVPCPRCLIAQIEKQKLRSQSPEAWALVDVNQQTHKAQISEPVLINQPSNETPVSRLPDTLDEILYSESAPSGDPVQAAVDTAFDGGRRVVHTLEQAYHRTVSMPPITPSFNASALVSVGASCDPACAVYCHLVEQCLQLAQQNRVVSCPQHGNLGPYFVAGSSGHVQAAHIAPDSVFQDIGDSYVINDDSVERGHFLGKGAFGAVFAGQMTHKTTGQQVSIAIKMLQPVQPDSSDNDQAVQSYLLQYQQEKARWDKDPLKHCCEAYLNARKELGILLSLQHPNIVPLMGISLQPLSLLLSLAPQGALSERLKEFMRAGAQLSPDSIAAILHQVASALEYLHSNQIIYRDLKSENVLVWSLPAPHDVEGMTHVKLADYGVSRCVLPSGTKGLAGTPPFIAPEIIQHNGEESYTEKVDCFSFGMFIYELLTLKLPFDGMGSAAMGAGGANLKGYVLSGGRPVLTSKELTYPMYILDLMSLCWSHDPLDRPSAAEMVSILSSPEITQILNVVSVGTATEVLCACAAPCRMPEESLLESTLDFTGIVSDVWLSCRDPSTLDCTLQIYTYTEDHCIQAKLLNIGNVIMHCMCVTDWQMWCADVFGHMHIYSLLDYSLVRKFQATSKSSIKIKCLTYGPHERQVYIILDNGSFIVCHTDVEGSDSSPVRMRCPGNQKPIHAIAVMDNSSGCSELWCGQSQGRVSIWNLHSEHGSLSHASHTSVDPTAKGDVVTMVTSPDDHCSVWSYVYPGTVVYRWQAAQRRISASLDVSQQIPVQDQVARPDCIQQSQLKPNIAQVTALSVHGQQLYTATTWGCLIVADKTSMVPSNVLRCHGSCSPYVRAICNLNFDLMTDPDDDLSSSSAKTDDSSLTPTDKGVMGHRSSLLITIGKGYRDLIRRSMYVKNTGGSRESNRNEMYLVAWRTHGWNAPAPQLLSPSSP